MDLWRPGSSSGVLVPVEFGWLPTLGDGLKGSYKFGAWYNSSTAPDVAENIYGLPLLISGGQPLMRHGQYTSTEDNQITVGLLDKGPFASRPADELGFAVGRTHVNSRIADAETQLDAAPEHGRGGTGDRSSTLRPVKMSPQGETVCK